MKDRLIELISGLPFSAEYEKYNSLEFAEHLADHLLANGVIVPPCKAGDTVYMVGVFTGQIIETKVEAIHHNESGIYLCLENFTTASIDQQLGKTVFLTKEEAEAELEKRGKENA